MRKNKADTEKTKCDLMRVAVKVFNKNGYSATRLEDVATAANVTRGAIYYHFGSKAEIFRAIVMENKDQTIRSLNKTLDNFSGSTLEALQKVFKTHLIRIAKEEFFRDVETLLFKTELSGELEDIADLFKIQSHDGLQRLINALKEGKKDGSIRKDLDEESFAFSLISFYYGIMSLWNVNRDFISLENKSEQISKYIFNACKA